MKKTIIKKFAVVLFALGTMISIQSAKATLTWSSPINSNSPPSNIVGIAKGATGSGQGNWTYEGAVAQALLDMGANQIANPTIGSDVTTLQTFATDYSGMIILGNTTSGGAGDSVDSGWDYVIAKYDGKNAGYILFYLGGQSADLPQYPDNFWTQTGQYGISGWTAFNTTTSSVPEPSTVVAGALLLLPLGVSALRILRKDRSTTT